MKRFAGAYALCAVYLLAWGMGVTAGSSPMRKWPPFLLGWCAVVLVGCVGLFAWANWPRRHPDDGYTGEEASDGHPG